MISWCKQCYAEGYYRVSPFKSEEELEAELMAAFARPIIENTCARGHTISKEEHD